MYIKKIILFSFMATLIVYFYVSDIGQLRSSNFILYPGTGLYKPTIPQYPPSHLQDYRTYNNAKLEFPTVFIHALIQINGARKIISSAQVRTHDLCHEPSSFPLDLIYHFDLRSLSWFSLFFLTSTESINLNSLGALKERTLKK